MRGGRPASELLRLRQRDRRQRKAEDVVESFTASVGETLNLTRAFDVLCHEVREWLDAEYASIWIHDRRSRELELRGGTELAGRRCGVRISTDDRLAPAAYALRRPHADLHSPGRAPTAGTLTIPLRGRRRALGTLVLEKVSAGRGRERERDVLESADVLRRQLPIVLENVQLLDDVLRSRQELANAFDAIAYLVVVSDSRGRIVHANQAFAERVGRTQAQLIDEPVTASLGAELGAWLNTLSHASSETGTRLITREIVDPVLAGPFVVTVTDLLDQERRRAGLVVVARDLNRESQLEAERALLRQRLAQSEKLAALGQFVAGVAHELNNPLQAVLGHLELLRVTGSLSTPIRRQVQTIHREADRAARIVGNLLAFAGSRRFVRQPVNINAVLKRVVALRLPACRARRIKLVRHYAQRLPPAMGEPLLVHQVFLNVLMNAEQAIPGAGPGRIEIVTGLGARGQVVVTIRDTGPGIAPDAMSRLFEPFYTTKAVGQGTGLGLAFAYGILDELGGGISAANHPDGGAVFTIELVSGPP